MQNNSRVKIVNQVTNRRTFIGNAYMTREEKLAHYSNLKVIMDIINNNHKIQF